jgi:predicted exporter
VTAASRGPVLVWLAGLAVCLAVIARTQFSTDLSAFLPRSPSAEQEVLIEQLREGVVSRLVLVGIEGDAPETLAQVSRRLAEALRGREDFVSVSNGAELGLEHDREFLWRNRYLLSADLTPERYSARGLRASLEEDLQLLGSPAGVLVRRTLPADPGGELVRILDDLRGRGGPSSRDGVWFSKDGKRALLVAQTRAAGSDIDAQEHALEAARAEFAAAAQGTQARLLLTGSGVFSVETRERVRSDALRLSIIAIVLVGTMLLALYRSVRVLALALAPVASGALAGIAAVALGFGAVHGITLAFGVTLIGEGVDYAIYLLTRVAPGAPPRSGFDEIWPTLRLGVLTSVCGFSAMLFSGFSGLAQLGLFSIVGLFAAAGVTRWVVPALLPAGFAAPPLAALSAATSTLVHRAPRLRHVLLLSVAIGAVLLLVRRDPVWADDLASLSPVPMREQILDQELRHDLGAPDVRYVVVVHAQDEEAALQRCEGIAAGLRRAQDQRWLEGFESPALLLPSRRAQRERVASLPPPETLRANLGEAMRGLPFRRDVFEPFLRDAAAARAAPPLTHASLDETDFASKVDSLLVKHSGGWSAMLPLRGVTQPDNIRREMSKETDVAPGTTAVLLDLKSESESLYRDYRREALGHSLAGASAISVLLFAALRSLRRVFDVLAPLAAAVVLTCLALLLAGNVLSIFHLIGLLLVVAVGSNYSLFFDRLAASDRERERTVVSLGLACVSTVIGFGLLSFSKVSVLNAIGSTVAVGAVMALAFSAILSSRPDNPAPRETK